MKRILLRSLFILASLLIFLACAELFFRIFMPQQTLSNSLYFTFHCFEEGKYRWIKLKPNSTCTLRSRINAFPETSIRTNSLGLRGSEISPKKTGEVRALFVGDSFTMGWGVDEEQAYPRLIGDLLKRQIPNLTTINAGFAGAGISGYYLYLKYYAFQLHPDVIIIGMFMGNDITGTTDTDWVKTDSSGLPTKIRSKTSYIDQDGYIRYKNPPLKFQIPILRESHVFAFLMDTFFPPTEPIVFYSPVQPHVCMMIESCTALDAPEERLKKVILGMKQLTDKQHVQLVMLLIPAEFQLTEETDEKYAVHPFVPLAKRSLPNDRFTDFFRENNIDYLDLLPDFKQHASEVLYYPKDDHWNAKGHALASHILEEYFKKVLSGTSSSSAKAATF